MSTTSPDHDASLIEAFGALSAAASAPQLLLRDSGRILAANRSAVELLGGDGDGLVGSHLGRWVAADSDLRELLSRFARSTSVLPGALVIERPGDEPIPCRCEGARVAAGSTRQQAPLLLLRIRPKTAARSRFTVLTQQLVELRREVARRRHAELLLEHQKGLLERIVGSSPLADVLNAIARFIESHSDECLCSILLLEKSSRRLMFGAGPSLPADYSSAIDGITIGPSVGSCGTAAHSGETVIVENIATDPLWADYRDLAAEHGLAACWSEPIKGPGGEVLGTLAMYYREPRAPSPDDLYLTSIGVDLTAIAILNEQSRATLRLRAEQLAEADRRKDQFLAMLSHELRNPLAPIVNTLEILGSQAESPDLLAHVDRLKRQTTHLSRLVDDLLDLSRISHGAVELEIETVDLRECVAQAIDTAYDLVRERSQQLDPPRRSTPVWVDGDHDRLRQVFANLLTNAAKYTPFGGSISVEIEEHDGMGVVRVRDDGQGLSPEVRERLFEPFSQGRKSALDEREGLGLGLTLVKQLVDCHAGQIEVVSEGIGKGSEFTVRLPLSDSAPPAEPSEPRPSETKAPGLDILLVEDNQDSADALSILLELWGHRAFVCHHGDEAVRAALEREPDVILMDIDLPGRDGYSVLRSLRQKGFSTENRLTVAMTGFGRLSDIETSKSAGFHHHMTKPADPGALRKLLADFSAGRSGSRAS